MLSHPAIFILRSATSAFKIAPSSPGRFVEYLLRRAWLVSRVSRRRHERCPRKDEIVVKRNESLTFFRTSRRNRFPRKSAAARPLIFRMSSRRWYRGSLIVNINYLSKSVTKQILSAHAWALCTFRLQRCVPVTWRFLSGLYFRSK